MHVVTDNYESILMTEMSRSTVFALSTLIPVVTVMGILMTEISRSTVLVFVVMDNRNVPLYDIRVKYMYTNTG